MERRRLGRRAPRLARQGGSRRASRGGADITRRDAPPAHRRTHACMGGVGGGVAASRRRTPRWTCLTRSRSTSGRRRPRSAGRAWCRSPGRRSSPSAPSTWPPSWTPDPQAALPPSRRDRAHPARSHDTRDPENIERRGRIPARDSDVPKGKRRGEDRFRVYRGVYRGPDGLTRRAQSAPRRAAGAGAGPGFHACRERAEGWPRPVVRWVGHGGPAGSQPAVKVTGHQAGTAGCSGCGRAQGSRASSVGGWPADSAARAASRDTGRERMHTPRGIENEHTKRERDKNYTKRGRE